MPRPKKEVHCSKCDLHHYRPVGRGCTLNTTTTGSDQLSSTIIDASLQNNGTSQHTDSSQVDISSKLDILATALLSIQEAQGNILERLTVLETSTVAVQNVSLKNTTVWDSLVNKQSATSVNRSAHDSIVSPPPVVPQQSPIVLPSVPPAVPTIQTMRDTAFIQQEVSRRLQQLDNAQRFDSSGNNLVTSPPSNKRVKSGRDRTGNEGIAKNYVQWPQELCYIGAERRRVKYDDLTLAQWMLGFTSIITQEENPLHRANMCTYLSNISQDIVDIGFHPCKGSHAVLLCSMEEGRVNWGQPEVIDNMRRTYIQRCAITTATKSNKSSVPCAKYQTSECNYTVEHTYNNVLQKHVCAFCFSNGGRLFQHRESQCMKKQTRYDQQFTGNLQK